MHLSEFSNPLSFPNRKRERPDEWLPLPDFAALRASVGEFSKSVPFHMTFEQVAQLGLREIVVAYDKNRAGKPIDMKSINKWYGDNGENISIENLGEFTFGYAEGSNELMLAKNHHRQALVEFGFWMCPDEVWERIKNERISCRLYDRNKLVGIYCKDDMPKPQGKGSFLRNPDMVVGHVVGCDTDENGKCNGRLAKRLTKLGRNLMRSKAGYLQSVAAFIYAWMNHERILAEDGVDILVPNKIYAQRSKIDQIIKTPYKGHEHEFPVSDEILNSLGVVIDEYCQFLEHYKHCVRMQKDDPKARLKLLTRTSFFTFWLQDRLLFNKLPANPKLVAEKLAYHFNTQGSEYSGGTQTLANAIKNLWNGSSLEVGDRIKTIREIMKKRVPAGTFDANAV